MRYPKLILLAVFLVLLGLSGWGISRGLALKHQIEPSLAAGSFLRLDYIQEDPAIQAELSSAKLKARYWDRAAELAAISLRFDDGLDYDFLKRYAYIFSAPDQASYYIVNNERTSQAGAKLLSAEELFGTLKPQPIKSEYLKINFVQALEIAERAGGGVFRTEHNGNCSVSLLLVQPEREVLSWVISYQDNISATNAIWRVNAASGSVEQQ